MMIVLVGTVVLAVLLSAVLGYVVGTTLAEMRASKPAPMPMVRRQVEDLDDDNPYPVGSDEFWQYGGSR